MHRPQPQKTRKKQSSYSKRMTALSVAVTAIIGLSACGIKGDLKRPAPIFDKNKTKTQSTTQQQIPSQTSQTSLAAPNSNPGKA